MYLYKYLSDRKKYIAGGTSCILPINPEIEFSLCFCKKKTHQRLITKWCKVGGGVQKDVVPRTPYDRRRSLRNLSSRLFGSAALPRHASFAYSREILTSRHMLHCRFVARRYPRNRARRKRAIVCSLVWPQACGRSGDPSGPRSHPSYPWRFPCPVSLTVVVE